MLRHTSPSCRRWQELQPLLGRRIEQRDLADVEREAHLARGLSGKVRLALDIGQVSLFDPTTEQRL